MSSKSSRLPATVLTLALGLFFVILGIQEIQSYNSFGSQLSQGLGNLFGQTDTRMLSLVFGILSLVSGAVLILWPWGLLSQGLVNFALLLVFIYWAFKIVFDLVLFGHFNPDELSWYKEIAWRFALLVSLWMVRSEN